MAGEPNFATAPRFRQRKISLKQQLRILWQKDLPSSVEDVRGDLLGIVETGVDKSEEDERHLQAVLSAATTSGNAADAYIPTPKATTKWNEYSKFYKPGWVESETYIRSSATVEDAQGNEYNMDEEDLAYLEQMNAKITDSKAKCTEDEFEMISTLIEAIVAEKQPFLSMDPERLLPYDELEQHILTRLEERRQAARNPLDPERLLLEAQSRDYASKLLGAPHRSSTLSVKTFGAQIYEHWRKRKIARKGKSIFPTLRFESGLASDDSDPYVCFRHREVRHSRKTRRTDQQNSGRLRKLHSEMQDARSIFELMLTRERRRLQQIQTDFEIFELRCRVKALKRKLKVGPEADDVSLLVSVPKRVRQEEQARQRREESERQRRAQLAKEKLEREREKRELHREAQKESSRTAAAGSAGTADSRRSTTTTATGSRIPDLDHVTVAQQFIERSIALDQAVSEKLASRREADKGWVNATDNMYVPYVDFFRSSLLSPPRSPPAHSESASNESANNESANNESANNESANNESAMDVEDEPRGLFRRPRNENRSADESSEGSQLLNLLTSSIELPHARAIDLLRRRQTRLPLPAYDLRQSDSPELVKIEDPAQKPAWFTDIDFQLKPNEFSVPRDAPQAVCRRRTFGNTTYIDRVLPAASNPLSKYGRQLVESPASEEDERLADRFRFDTEMEDPSTQLLGLCNDPARLNGIEPQTQSLRFSSMLTAKAGELLVEVQQQRRRQIQMLTRRQQLQQQQRAAAEAQAQQNAQLQTQTSVRLQQSQRANQRQQRRKLAGPDSKDALAKQGGTASSAPTARNGSGTPNGNGSAAGTPNGNGSAAGTPNGTPNGSVNGTPSGTPVSAGGKNAGAHNPSSAAGSRSGSQSGKANKPDAGSLNSRTHDKSSASSKASPAARNAGQAANNEADNGPNGPGHAKAAEEKSDKDSSRADNDKANSNGDMRGPVTDRTITPPNLPKVEASV